MNERYKKIEKMIEDWFSLKLRLGVNDIMPEVVFLYEQNKELTNQISELTKENNVVN